MSGSGESWWTGPDAPASWYLAGSAAAFRPGSIAACDAGGVPVAVFRTASGALRAIDAHCAHAGASLALGRVDGERVRCPLHDRAYDGLGRCGAEDALALTHYPVVEALGSVFVFAGARTTFELPELGDAGAALVYRAGRAMRLRCPWYAAVANGFDVNHLRTVHERELLEPAVFGRVGSAGFRLSYRARPAGASRAESLLRRLAPDGVRATVTCSGGSLVTIESRAGRHRASLAVCLRPEPGGVEIVPIVAVRRSRFGVGDGARAALALWLYRSFLVRDVGVLEGMRFRPRPVLPEDACLAECVDYLSSLPPAARGASASADHSSPGA